MVIPAWVLFLTLIVIIALSATVPVAGAALAASTAFMVGVRLLVMGIRPFKDEIEFL